jgi:hypothetical protein
MVPTQRTWSAHQPGGTPAAHRTHGSAPQVVPCSNHGTSAWCYVQFDGSHMDSDRCRCLLQPRADCPIDVHQAAALGARRLI